MRKLIRSALTWLLASVVLVIAISVAAEFFIEVAKDKGFYADAGVRWDGVMGQIATVLRSGFVLYTVVGLAGVVVGLWTDTVLKGKVAAIPAPKKEGKDDGIPSVAAQMRYAK